jgi:plastocyanin
MTRRPTVLALLATAILALAACSSNGASAPAASVAPPASAAPAASVAPASAAPASSGSTAGATCTTSTATATVQVTMKDIAFAPSSVQAKVGDVIGFTNDDSADHTATLDDQPCSTDTLAKGQSGALTFSAPGTYAFHCKIHSNMHGTITVS